MLKKLYTKILVSGVGSVIFGISLTVMASPMTVDNEMTPEVQENEYIFTAASKFPVIQTYGATTCVILVLHNDKTKMSALAHISAAVNVRESIRKIISDFKRTKNVVSDIKAEIYGGWKNSSEIIVKDIKRALRREGVALVKDEAMRFVGPDLKDPFALLSSAPQDAAALIHVQFDLRLGQASYYVESIPSKFSSAGFEGILPENEILYRHDASISVK
jgi:hypothetical protein